MAFLPDDAHKRLLLLILAPSSGQDKIGRSWHKRLLLLILGEQLGNASPELRQEIRRIREYADLAEGLAEVVGRLQKLDPEAIARALRELDPNGAEYHSCRGLLYVMKDDDEEAIASYRRATELEPNNAVCHWLLGASYLRVGNYEEAIGSYRRAIELEPNEAKNHWLLARCHAELQKYEEAIASFRRAIELEPNDAENHRLLAECYAAVGNYQEAMAHFRRAIELKPNDYDANLGLAKCCLEVGLYEEAENYIRKADEVMPDNKPRHDYELRLPLYRLQGRWRELRELVGNLVQQLVYGVGNDDFCQWVWEVDEFSAIEKQVLQEFPDLRLNEDWIFRGGFGLGQMYGYARGWLDAQAGAAPPPAQVPLPALLHHFRRQIGDDLLAGMGLLKEALQEESRWTRMGTIKTHTEVMGALEQALAGITRISVCQEEAEKAYRSVLKELREVAAERAEAVKRSEKRLGTYFGDLWPRLGQDSKSSLATAEMLYQESEGMAGFDYAQPGVGFCRAVESELAAVLLRKLRHYLQGEGYAAELKAGERRVAVARISKLGLGETAALLRDAAAGVEENKIVRRFVEERYAGGKGFLLEELPALLDRLAGYRNGAAHREPFGRPELEELRTLVLGDLSTPGRGLLVRLLALKREK